MGKKTNKLIKFGGKVLTVGYAVKCAKQGFKGCSKAELKAVGTVLARTISAFKR